MDIKSKDGITIIALVVMIVVLLILAGIVIVGLTGDNGLINKSGEAKDETEKSALEEKIEIYRLDIQNGDKATLKERLVEDGLVDESELDEKGIASLDDEIIVISNFNGLKELSKNVENGEDYAGKIIYMTNDIDCMAEFNEETGELISGENFVPIGSSNSTIENEEKEGSIKHEFQGTFDGFGYEINNMYIKKNETTDFCTALFGYIGENGIVKELTIANSYIHGYYETGSLQEEVEGK